MVSSLKIGWDHFHYMMHQGLTLWSLLKLGPYLFSNFSGCGLVIEMVCATCGPCFFGHSQATWLGFPPYKQRLFLRRCCFFCSVKDLNIVLSICMGSSFGKLVEGWANIIGGKILCVIDGTKLFCVVDVGSWHLSCWRLKSLLSHWTSYAMAWCNVEGFNKVNSKSFTSLRNPNYNWLMNIASPHEILQANCLNFDAYTTIEGDPWQRYHILMLKVHSLSEFPKVALNSSRNVSKSLNKGDYCSNKGVNH
jgi:hypothetical protein